MQNYTNLTFNHYFSNNGINQVKLQTKYLFNICLDFILVT